MITVFTKLGLFEKCAFLQKCSKLPCSLQLKWH